MGITYCVIGYIVALLFDNYFFDNEMEKDSFAMMIFFYPLVLIVIGIAIIVLYIKKLYNEINIPNR